MSSSMPAPEALDAHDDDPVVRLCAFFVGADEYVVDIMRIEEILQAPSWTPLPQPAVVDGMLQLRGEVVPLLELPSRLATSGAAPKLKPKLVVCRIGRRRLGLLVDGVTQVLRARLSDLKPAPAPAARGARPWVMGVCSAGDRLRLLLDVKALAEAHR